MENFIVSARKYRPSTFDTVVGQSSITNTLKNAIKNNHVAQAYLFCGPRGVGKTTCARILAKTINCQNPTENHEACDQCESCLSFNKSASFNIHELDAASNNSVDDIRALVDKVRFAPQVGKYSIYIIDEVHMLSQAAFNAFLKTLEEPPAHAKFILATTERNKIIPTILSRCQVFDFKRITIEDIALHLQNIALKEGINAEPDALHIIANKADGALRDALSIFDQIVSFAGNDLTYKVVIDNLNVLDYDYYFSMTEYINACDIHSSIKLLNDILYNGFDGHNFIIGLGEHCRNLLISKDESTLNLLEVGFSVKEKYKSQSTKCTIEFLIKCLNYVNKCDVQYNISRNKLLQLELTLMQMCSINSNFNLNDPFNPETAEKIEIKHVPKAQPTISQNTIQSKPLSVISQPVAKPEVSVKPQITDSSNVKRPSSFKISEITSSFNSTEEKKNDINIVEEIKTNIFTQDELEVIWNKYAEQISEDKSFLSILSKRKPILKDNYIIELLIDNKAQLNELNTKKVELLDFLRKDLNNNQIQLEIEISKAEVTEAKPYTVADKLQKMQEKNPNLDNFRKQFDLEIEY